MTHKEAIEVSEMWRHKFEAAERQMALEREDNARLRKAGDYLAKCIRLTNPLPDSMAEIMLEEWKSAKVGNA